MTTITRTDIETFVSLTLEASAPESDSIDQAGVVSEIIDTYGLVSPESIDHDEFWSIVARHDS